MSYACFARQTFINMLGTLELLIDKAVAAGMGSEVLAEKLTEDMFPLELQFRVALNQVLLALNQVGGEHLPLEEIPYKSLFQVKERVQAVRSRLEQSILECWAAPTDEVDLTLPNGVRFVMSSENDIQDWIMPNFYFHVTLAYALLRNAGLPLGKMDFLSHMTAHRAESAAS